MKRALMLPLGGLLLFGAALLAPAQQAAAHAAYDHSTPARDEVVQQPPARVDVWFKEEIFRQAGADYVRVFDEQDAQVSTGDGSFDDDDRTHMFADMPANAAPGRYIVRWMATSDEDGDTDEGAFCYYVAVQPTAEQQAECATFVEAETPVATSVGATATAATPTTAGSETTIAPTPTIVTPATEDDGGSGAPTGAIIGGIIAGAVAVVIIVGAVVIWLRRLLA